MTLDDLYQRYEEEGYVILPDFLESEEVAALRDVTDRLEALAAGLSEETAVYDFETNEEGEVTIQRIKKPHRVDPLYLAMAKHPRIMTILSGIIGSDIRLSHSKINMKAARGGSALEWHQDWAFAPHTAMQTCVVSVLVDAALPENGAMQVIRGSHKGPLLEHHDDEGFFAGAIHPRDPGLDLSKAVSIVGGPGTLSLHHPLTIHGSGTNRSGAPRRILFLEYAAAAAYPLFYSVDWQDYESRMMHGRSSSAIRIESNPIKLPVPSRAGSSIYKIQAGLKERLLAAAK
jgi:ectoine hydroxylase-related dioxygenase (phytanoyl-CoA dioxygenase family)